MAETFTYNGALKLESGFILPGYHLAYTTYGTLNDSGDNAIWIFHALTANSNPHEWWPGLVGPGKVFDPDHYFIVCVNMPGCFIQTFFKVAFREGVCCKTLYKPSPTTPNPNNPITNCLCASIL